MRQANHLLTLLLLQMNFNVILSLILGSPSCCFPYVFLFSRTLVMCSRSLALLKVPSPSSAMFLPIQFVVPLCWSALRHFIRTGIYMPYEAANVSVNPIQFLFSCCVKITLNEIQYIDRFFYLVLFGIF